jgi:hypothetical protein
MRRSSSGTVEPDYRQETLNKRLRRIRRRYYTRITAHLTAHLTRNLGSEILVDGWMYEVEKLSRKTYFCSECYFQKLD